MITQLRHSFFQVFTIMTLWVTLLATIFFGELPIQMSYLWNIAGIAFIAAIVFGMMYNLLWNHFTLKPVWNIVISSTFNIAGGMAMVWLFSVDMFQFIAPWFPGMWLLSIVLHIIAFYFYARMDSKKKAEELNNILK
ncbi:MULTISPECIES: hypothetical protein [Paenibacillus]|uniref:hypothetical protein n=1 Tax=Paenibacillus TaxID=44249 RepID=UPI000B8A3C2D|nr:MULTISPECIES: hypothetical protein [Paenibacillus]MBD8840131.1 hypothetical protein [Paenibacillus sp. CFBP 13594]PRA08725.1 hypothetical protein CQ043_01720 [Paenibacillus sp. MYb63]PRA48659.1 hypothetical protein CQ061_10175 [Paenibacillus sp. MYb67]QZN72999.1 hypothetical protein K5K90_16095 [Paenibacillus sp. DR312]